jgi:glyoxylase-like metal-dependent hydrolase (beta-lactamase superfamily II)
VSTTRTGAVNREVEDSDEIGGGAAIVGVPEAHAREHRHSGAIGGVLFTGDTIACLAGAPILVPSNGDRERAIEAARKQARRHFDVACFGHGRPLIRGASQRFGELAVSLSRSWARL